jgi:hypothetical protein
MKEFTNADRVERARAAMESFNRDNDAAVSALDFLVDLQHFYNFAQAEDIAHPTFEEALEAARTHFEAEQKEAL